MNCDQAFEAFTDPTGSGDVELHQHLEACARCRQMREVLAPALDRLISVSRDAETFEEFADQHGEVQPVSTFLSPAAVRIAEEAASRVNSPSSPARLRDSRRTRPANFARYTVVALMAGVVSVSVMGVFLGWNSNQAPAADHCTWSQRGDTESSQSQSSQTLVASCVTCHMPDSKVNGK